MNVCKYINLLYMMIFISDQSYAENYYKKKINFNSHKYNEFSSTVLFSSLKKLKILSKFVIIFFTYNIRDNIIASENDSY